MVEFANDIDEGAYARVLMLDQAIAAHGLSGLIETVPAYVSLLVRFNPLETDPDQVERRLRTLLNEAADIGVAPRQHVIPVCYESSHAPDIDAVARQLNISAADVVRLHGEGQYRVYMYGFAPGYAYMGGVPEALRMPRKPGAVRGHPVGSILIAGEQCLISTLEMPTGWWVIGQTPLAVFSPQDASPFLFQPGDEVRFEAVSAQRFAELADQE